GDEPSAQRCCPRAVLCRRGRTGLQARSVSRILSPTRISAQAHARKSFFNFLSWPSLALTPRGPVEAQFRARHPAGLSALCPPPLHARPPSFSLQLGRNFFPPLGELAAAARRERVDAGPQPMAPGLLRRQARSSYLPS